MLSSQSWARRRLPWGWLVALAVPLLALGLETDWGRHWRPVVPELPPPLPVPVPVMVLPDFTLPALVQREETTARTLFNPTRRPAPAPVVEVAKPQMRRGQFVLSGVVLLDGKTMAFLRENANKKTHAVRQGDQINGLTVALIEANRVRFTFGDENEEIVLAVARSPAASTATTPGTTPVTAPVVQATPMLTSPDSATPSTLPRPNTFTGGRRGTSTTARPPASAQPLPAPAVATPEQSSDFGPQPPR